MDDSLSIYGHDKATDPRYAPVDGRVPIGVARYYPCCATPEPPCDKVVFRLPDGSSTEFLLGRIDSAYPRLLWWRRDSPNFPGKGPRGVRLLKQRAGLPCLRYRDEPHEWWEWEWDTRWWKTVQYPAWQSAFGPDRFTTYPNIVQYRLFGLWPCWTVTRVSRLKGAICPWLRPFVSAKEQPND